MIRAELAVAAIALVLSGAVASAQAQTQTASAEPTIWDHNGSVVYLVANGQCAPVGNARVFSRRNFYSQRQDSATSSRHNSGLTA
jgi:hypothetical protein